MTLDELIKKRKELFDSIGKLNTNKIEIKLATDEKYKLVAHDFLDGKDCGYHYKIYPETFKTMLENYKKGAVDINYLWEQMEKYFIYFSI